MNTYSYNSFNEKRELCLSEATNTMKCFHKNINAIMESKLDNNSKVIKIYNITTLLGCLLRDKKLSLNVEKYIELYYIKEIEPMYFTQQSPFTFNLKGMYNYDNVHHLRKQIFTHIVGNTRKAYYLPSVL